MTEDSEHIAQATQRTVGIATLRRLRRLVDEESALERRQTRYALLIGLIFLGAIAAFVAWLLRRSL